MNTRNRGRAGVFIQVALLCLLGLPAILHAQTAFAEVHRYGLFIGNNLGEADETPLEYAEADARNVRAVFTELGGFHPSRSRLLLGASPQQLQRALTRLEERIESSVAGGHSTTVLIYYSGHADEQRWHMGPETSGLAVDELKRWLASSPADLAIVISDACRSPARRGELRSKGGKRAPPFEIVLDDEAQGKGRIFLHASARGELAHESRLLRASLFTHYFVSGLRGAADLNNNAAVELREAFAHARDRTASHSSRDHASVQRPSFDYDLEGQRDIVLTRLDTADSGRLQVPSNLAIIVFEGGATGPVRGELKAANHRRSLSLPPGRHFVRLRGDQSIGYEGWVMVRSGKTAMINIELLEQFEVAQGQPSGEKGGQQQRGGLRSRFQALYLDYRFTTPTWPRARPCQGLSAGHSLIVKRLLIRSELGWCRDAWVARQHDIRNDQFDLSVGISHRIAARIHEFDFGVHAGAGWVYQKLSVREELKAAIKAGIELPPVTLEEARDHDIAYHFGVNAQWSIAIHRHLALHISLRLEGVGFRQQSIGGLSHILRFRARPQVGAAWRF